MIQSNTLQSKTVSVIMPCLNEIKFIARCLDSLLANDYDKTSLEIIVVDGMSTDGTRDILKKYCEQHSFIKVLDNRNKITPAALNIGIKASKYDIILRVDAHAVYESNYISTLVSGLEKYHVDNIGGIRETALIKSTPLTLALSIAISHPFTAGNAHYRTGSDKVRYVDTVFCGCFPRELFKKIGYFNENIIRTEDRDFNARIVNSGGKIILIPGTKCTYYPRTRFWEYLKWNTYGPFRLLYNHKFTDVNMASWRNMVPALFILYHIAVLPLFLYSVKTATFLSLPLLIYWIANLFFSLKASFQYRSMMLAPLISIVFATTHYSYGFGSLFGMPWYVNFLIRKFNDREY